jgi:hypothetical protein
MRLNIQSGAWWVLVSAKILSTQSVHYGEPNATEYPQFYRGRSLALIRIYDAHGKVIKTHEHKGDFSKPADTLPLDCYSIALTRAISL